MNIIKKLIFCFSVLTPFFFLGCRESEHEPDVTSDSEIWVTFNRSNLRHTVGLGHSRDSIKDGEFLLRITRNKIGSDIEEQFIDTIFKFIDWPIKLENGWVYNFRTEYAIDNDTFEDIYQGHCHRYFVLTNEYTYNLEIARQSEVHLDIMLKDERFYYFCAGDVDDCTHIGRKPFTPSE